MMVQGNVKPADLPRDTLVRWSNFVHMAPGMTLGWIGEASADGRFPAPARSTPRGVHLYEAGAVADWLASELQSADFSVRGAGQ